MLDAADANDGGLFWGFNADWDALPDLHDIVGHVEAEFAALTPDERDRRWTEVRSRFTAAGADAVIRTLTELPALTGELTRRVS